MSMPSVSSAKASGLSSSFTWPSCAARGQKNVPCSSRLVISHIPVPSQQSTLMSLRRLFVKTKSAPPRASSLSLSATNAWSVLTPARMSHASSGMNTLRQPGKLSMTRASPGSPGRQAPRGAHWRRTSAHRRAARLQETVAPAAPPAPNSRRMTPPQLPPGAIPSVWTARWWLCPWLHTRRAHDAGPAPTRQKSRGFDPRQPREGRALEPAASILIEQRLALLAPQSHAPQRVALEDVRLFVVMHKSQSL